jgi:hypothetical protein
MKYLSVLIVASLILSSNALDAETFKNTNTTIKMERHLDN